MSCKVGRAGGAQARQTPNTMVRFTGSLKNTVVFTDVKYDDIIALQILVNATPRETPITVVITNVADKERAAGLLAHFFGQAIFVKTDGSTGGAPKSHEPMFARYNPYELTVFDPTQNYIACFMLAPIVDHCRETLRRAQVVFMGLGYNTGSCGIDKEFIESLNTVVLMNNMSPTIYPYVEGGRFAANDDGIWRHCDDLSGGGTKLLREDALADSREFMVRQITKSGISGVTLDNLFDDMTLELCETCATPNRYMGRIIDQLRRKTVDVETSDGQHMALWLHSTELCPVKLAQGSKFLEIHRTDEPTNMLAPCNISQTHLLMCFDYGTNIAHAGRKWMMVGAKNLFS